MEVVVWLRRLGLGWYEAAFRGGERFRKLMKRPVPLGVRKMIDKGRSQIGQCNCVERGWLLTLAFVAVAIAAWLTAPIAQIESIAFAAEVDAIGAPAPVGFADIIERVKPAVVGIRVRIEE